MKLVILFSTILVSSQASASSLDDALKAAMGGAEKDHSSVQAILEVHPDQIVKAKFQRPKETAKIDLNQMGVNDGILSESPIVSSVKLKMAARPKAKAAKQLGDI